MHGKENVPYCIPYHPPTPPPLSFSHTHSVRNHNITASTPTKVKMNALTTCGGSRTREWERTWEGKKGKEKTRLVFCRGRWVRETRFTDTDINSMYHSSCYGRKVRGFIMCRLSLAWPPLVRGVIFRSCFTIIADNSSKSQIPKVLCLFLRCAWEGVMCGCDRVCLESQVRHRDWVTECVCVCVICQAAQFLSCESHLPPTITPVSRPETTNHPVWKQSY